MHAACTGVILAGGMSTRYGGENKALLQVGGVRILDRLFEVFSALFEEIVIVTNRPTDFLEWDALIAADIYPVRSSLTGIHAGLFYATHPFAFICACDTPFLKKEVVEAVLERIGPKADLVIPETAAGMEPLCAAYARGCIKTVETHLRAGKFKIQRVFEKSRIVRVPESRLREKDPGLVSFFNVNTPEDLASAEELIRRGALSEAAWTSPQ